ncbi:MAG: ATP synthase subunit b [Alphaproteobacteria bacterium MarineAlpha5_Bin8]|nr:MAG: ATP synthase subunit b [Alphaproteobacteria bacterium MarineAlpha5_Bin7]PPR48126.1 MAG: ATP synthase subunit b [Alphaproteobacteria bacterium MarineAlpha5_Bin8]PPR53219.1 MAG: ATP synthase subunit b [Alphaproteobacteria bacterium MarineAlpha5_Bin6]|tara:strand:+ start:1221 stop:1706 length:486 start_codon:yes stop_codon:yes gene_type:complete
MFSDPQFWVLISFIIFVVLIFNPIKKILTKNLDDKIEQIKTDINNAEKLKNDTQVILSEIKKRQNDVKNEINLINEQAKERIGSIENETHLKLQEQLNKKNAIAAAKIEQMTRDANLEIQQEITQISISASTDLLIKKLSDKDKQNIVKESTEEIGSIIKN